ncbi:MBL fold metallo-hydrolase [Chloroflexota bacterium]
MAFQSQTGLIEVAPGAWAVVLSIISPNGGGPNAGFVLAGDHMLVIDSLMSPGTGQQLAEYVRQVTDKSPTYLINTHHHADHIFGNQTFSPPATIIAHENVREVMLSQGEALIESVAERFSRLVPKFEDTIVVAPQITYRDRMTLHFGGRTVELIHPGVAHTHGDTMVYLPDDKLLYAGDILFNHIFPPIVGSSTGWIAVIEEVEAMDVDTIVPGHGYIATKKELGELKQCLIELRSQVKDCFTRGLSVEEATKKIDLPYLQWPHPERLGPDVGLIYKELAKEGLDRLPTT